MSPFTFWARTTMRSSRRTSRCSGPGAQLDAVEGVLLPELQTLMDGLDDARIDAQVGPTSRNT
jgi:hypothetical protein